MFKLYSRQCAYVLQVLSAFPVNRPDEPVTASWLCRQFHVSESFTRKALQTLSQAGYLRTVTGPSGGYTFTRDPKKISLIDIINTIEGPDVYSQCILGLPQCDDHVQCPMHKTWKKMKAGIQSNLETKTVADLMKIQSIRKK